MSQTDDINKLLTDQLINALNLLAQFQSIGSTHILYPQAVIKGTQDAINQVIQILSAPKSVTIPKPEPTQKEELKTKKT